MDLTPLQGMRENGHQGFLTQMISDWKWKPGIKRKEQLLNFPRFEKGPGRIGESFSN
jgi:hypothetical protein